MLGSEGEAFRLVAGIPGARDRPAEFRATAATFPKEESIAALEAADRLLHELGPRISPERLAAMHKRPSDGYVDSGLGWLVNRHCHISQHLGHVQLTRQLLGRAPAGSTS